MSMALFTGGPSTASTWGNSNSDHDWGRSSAVTYVYSNSNFNSTYRDYDFKNGPTAQPQNTGRRSGNPHWTPFWHCFYPDMPLPARPRKIVPTRAVDRRARSVHSYRPRIPVWSARRWKSLT